MERRRTLILYLRSNGNMDWKRISRKIGFLRAGWWIIHLLGITTVYTVGHLLWR